MREHGGVLVALALLVHMELLHLHISPAALCLAEKIKAQRVKLVYYYGSVQRGGENDSEEDEKSKVEANGKLQPYLISSKLAEY